MVVVDSAKTMSQLGIKHLREMSPLMIALLQTFINQKIKSGLGMNVMLSKMLRVSLEDLTRTKETLL
jgi:hypothetical protein